MTTRESERFEFPPRLLIRSTTAIQWVWGRTRRLWLKINSRGSQFYFSSAWCEFRVSVQRCRWVDQGTTSSTGGVSGWWSEGRKELYLFKRIRCSCEWRTNSSSSATSLSLRANFINPTSWKLLADLPTSESPSSSSGADQLRRVKGGAAIQLWTLFS